MKKILHIAVDVQKQFYFLKKDYGGYNAYAANIAAGIHSISLHPDVQTVWAMTPHLGSGHYDFWDTHILHSANQKVDCSSQEKLFVRPQETHYILNKSTASAFSNPLLQPFIRSGEFSKIVITGSFSSECVLSTMLDALVLFPQLEPVMLTDLCGTYEHHMHDQKLRENRRWLAQLPTQHEIYMTSTDFLETLIEKPAPPIQKAPVSILATKDFA